MVSILNVEILSELSKANFLKASASSNKDLHIPTHRMYY